MFEAKSFEIRRFFDLLGSTFCVSLYSLITWQNEFRFGNPDKLIYLPLFVVAGLSVYLTFYLLVWRFVKTKFLLGYANFLLISILSVSAAVVLVQLKELVVTRNLSLSLNRLEFLILRTDPTDVLLFYWATCLPLALFWLLGVLTVWKFSKRNFLR